MLIAIDLGTQGTKAVLCDRDGKVLAEAFEASKLIHPEPGAVEQDPEEMLASVVRCLAEISGKAPRLKPQALCLCGQMAGVMGVDRDGLAVTPYDSWLDTRCGKYRQPFLDCGEAKIIALTGAPVTYAHGPKILWWKNERPEVFRRIYRFVQPAAYVVMRLCGLQGAAAFIDHTYLHFSGFADTAAKKWSTDLLAALGVPADKMPRIVKPWDRVGGLTPDMAKRCGLPAGLPVAAGCGDTAASIFGAGVIQPGKMLDVAGTASVLACAAGVFRPDVGSGTIMFPNGVMEGTYTPMAYINGGGMCLKWFRDDVLGGEFDYERLNEMAAEVVPGSEDLLFLPHFSGRVCPNDTAVRGAYVNLHWKHGRAHMYRAILENIAYEYGIYQEIIRGLIPELTFHEITAAGGGSKGRLFMQIKADVLGLPVRTINLVDTSLLACCGVAGFMVGLYERPDSLPESLLQETGRVEPDLARRDFYAARRRIYAGLFTALRGTFEELHGLKPWR